MLALLRKPSLALCACLPLAMPAAATGGAVRTARPATAAEVVHTSASAPASGSATTIRFASNEWPPFVTATLPSNGLTGSLVGAVYERMGAALNIEYFPWKRTMELGLRDARYAGFLAVWRSPEREKLCHFSTSIGNTVTVLAFLKEAPIQASALAELQGVRIGTVAGYTNGGQFDGMVETGTLRTEEAYSDELNLRKLLTRRFPVMVIEKRVLRHLLASDRFTREERERIGYAEGLFRERSAHICFKRTPVGLAQQRAFNDAARDVDLQKAERDYWRRAGYEVAQAALR